MSISFTTWVGTKGAVEQKSVTRPALSGHQTFVKTTHSGLCGTDVHYHHAGIGMGHEGAGVVAEIGPEVTNLKVGDRVAWGWVGTQPYSKFTVVKYLQYLRLLDRAESAPHAWRVMLMSAPKP
jgi:threonine dehydrogenase-like Zn-dependent dehydrogenase